MRCLTTYAFNGLLSVAVLAAGISAFMRPAHGVCSVLNGQPCLPPQTFCSVFDSEPCLSRRAICSVFSEDICAPEPDAQLGHDLQLTIESRNTPSSGSMIKSTNPLDPKSAVTRSKRAGLATIGDVFSALRECWIPPGESEARQGTQMSVRLSFKRDGAMMGPPRLTYISKGTPNDVRKIYWDAIGAAFKRCTPLPFTKGLGEALAGRPFAIRFVDNRTMQRPAQKSDAMPLTSQSP
ncbi:MAG TPA: hypothetical protein VHN11_10625 [Xanthobacteraceae bacterium]|jgi:hypothetical protein|nr:hypothetical protein [Xanthobacteraceae bacterium]